MSNLRSLLLPWYRWATHFQRSVAARRFTASRAWPAAILFYHRVADHTPNPWTISTNRFLQQLDFIESIADFASLDDVRLEQRSSQRDRLKVAITFDDGYSENFQTMFPELTRRAIPCTYFVATDYVERGEAFPHDVARGKPLRPHSITEIQSMADAGIQMGGHTRSHLDLGQSWSFERLQTELKDSRKKLQDWTGQPIDYFAFPYGLPHNISQAAIDMVLEAGYRCFVSAYGGWNFPNGEDYHLTRFHGDPCTEALRNWLTLDPRHLRRNDSFEFTLPTTSPVDDRVEEQPVVAFPSVQTPSFQPTNLPTSSIP